MFFSVEKPPKKAPEVSIADNKSLELSVASKENVLDDDEVIIQAFFSLFCSGDQPLVNLFIHSFV